MWGAPGRMLRQVSGREKMGAWTVALRPRRARSLWSPLHPTAPAPTAAPGAERVRPCAEGRDLLDICRDPNSGFIWLLANKVARVLGCERFFKAETKSDVLLLSAY